MSVIGLRPGLQWDSGNESSNCVAFIRSAGNESCHETTTATAQQQKQQQKQHHHQQQQRNRKSFSFDRKVKVACVECGI